jgi:hypothetical protein
VKILVYSASGDPLFVRDEHGHDFEVETDWVTDARLRDWATDHETKWNEIWSEVCNARPSAHGTRLGTMYPPKQHLTAPPAEEKSPQQKLADFLSANPDVLAAIEAMK